MGFIHFSWPAPIHTEVTPITAKEQGIDNVIQYRMLYFSYTCSCGDLTTIQSVMATRFFPSIKRFEDPN